MKWHQRHLVIGLTTTAFAFCLLAALLTACGKHSRHDDCDALGLAAYEAPARPHPRAARPRVSLRKPAAPAARRATTSHGVVHHAAARPTATHHVVVHHVVHPRPTHVVVHHHDDLC